MPLDFVADDQAAKDFDFQPEDSAAPSTFTGTEKIGSTITPPESFGQSLASNAGRALNFLRFGPMGKSPFEFLEDVNQRGVDALAEMGVYAKGTKGYRPFTTPLITQEQAKDAFKTGIAQPLGLATVPDEGVLGDIEKGAGQFGAQTVEGLSTGESLIPMALGIPKVQSALRIPEAVRPVVSEAVGRGFQVPMIAGIPEGVQAIQQAQTPEDVVAATLGVGSSALLPLAIEKGINASKIRPPTTLHGALRSFAREGAREMPIEESRRGVQPQTPEDAQKGQARVLLDDDYAALERKAIDEAEKLGSPAATVEEFTGQTENEPFAGQFMRPTEKGMEIRRGNFRDWLESIPKERRGEAISQRVLEEHIHRHTTGEDAAAYLETLTPLERAIEHRAYTGEWTPERLQEKRGVQFSDTQLGHEAIRRRMQRLMNGTTSEISEAALRERWTLKSLDALSGLVRNVRELAGTKASGEGLKLLSQLDDNLKAAKAAISGQQPAAFQKMDNPASPSADELISINPEDVSPWLKEIKYSPDHAGQWAAKMTPDDIGKLSTESQRLRKEAGEDFEQMAKAKGKGEFDQAAMTRSLQKSLKSQTLREVVEDYQKLQEAPAAFQKELGLEPAKKGEERPTAVGMGAKPFTARDLEQAGAEHLQAETARALSQLEAGKAVKPTTFKDYRNAMQAKYGDLSPGQLYEGYQDALYKRLLGATGRELEALAKSVGVKANRVSDAVRTPQVALETEGATGEARAQIRAEAKGQTQRERYRNLVAGRIAEKMLSEAAPEAKPASRTNISPEDLRQNNATKEPGFVNISQHDVKHPEILAQRLVQDARRSNRDPVTLTKRLTAVIDRQTGKVHLVSTYPHGRSGAMLLDPSVSTIKAHRPLDSMLARYRPVASMLLDEPVQNFRQTFDSLGDFEAKLGTDARRASQQVFEAPLREGEQPEPGSWENGGAITDAEAGAILDHVTSEVGRFDSVDDVKASLSALKEDTNFQVLSGYRKLAAELLRRNPELSNEGLINQLAQNIYENHQAAPDYETFVKRTVGQGRAEDSAGIATRPNAQAPKPAEAVSGARELTLPRFARKSVPAEPLPPKIVPHGTSEPAAFDKALRAAKDEVDRVGDAVRLLATRQGMINDIAKTIDETGNRTNIEATQAETNIRLASANKPSGLKRFAQPWQRGNKQVLHAANAVVEAQFQHGRMAEFLDQLDQAEANAKAMLKGGTWRERNLAKAYMRDIDASRAEVKYAQDHWRDPELQATARRTKAALDKQYALEKAMGFDLTKEEGYVPHRLLGVWGGAETLFQLPRVLGTKYRMPRTFDTHYEALAAGPYMRVTHDIASLVGHRTRQGLGNIYRHEWKAGLLATTFPDGTPMALEPKMGPHGPQSPHPAYKVIDTNGLGHLAVHEDIYKPLRNLLSPSYFDDAPIARNILRFEQMLKHSLLIGDFFHYFRMGYFGASIIGKQVLNQGKTGWSVLDIAEKNIPEAVKKGIISQKDADWANTKVNGLTRRQIVELAYKQYGANLGKIQDALYKDLLTDLTPTAGPLRRGLSKIADPSFGRYNRFLFERLTRGLMAESIVREFEKQSKANPKLSPDALMRDISKDINERFGNIGRQGLFKSKTAQDFARLLFLAPQWVEGLATTEARAYSRLSGLSSITGQRRGVTHLGTTGRTTGKAMVFMFGLTQVINLITRGKPTWENEEEGHKMDAYIPSVGSDGEGFWFNPLSVFNEVTHDVYRMTEAKMQQDKPAGETAIDILSNKESPISRALVVMGAGRTPRGERITSTPGRFLTEPAKAIAPVPITFGKYGQAAGHALAPGTVPPVPKGLMQRQTFGSFGLKIEPALSQPSNMRRLADEFMREADLKKETGWEQIQNDEASYTKLREAIRNGDNAKAAKLFEALKKGRTEKQIIKYMKKASVAPFTGNSKAEKPFIASLDDKGLENYQAAREQQAVEFDKFADFVNTQP